MAEQLLNAQITKVLQEDVFYPGRKFSMPTEALVQAKMLESDLQRLLEWLQAHDKVELLASGKSELLILNSTMLQKQAPVKETIEAES